MALAIITALDRGLRRAALSLLSGYQRFLGAFFAGHCRFHPTCSEYAKQCFQNVSFPRAAGLTLWRLLRCHPFCPGGEDLPPQARRAEKE